MICTASKRKPLQRNEKSKLSGEERHSGQANAPSGVYAVDFSRAGVRRETIMPVFQLSSEEKKRLPKKVKLISCDIFTREICAAVMRSSNTVDVEFLPKGLHDIGCEGMRARLQEAIERVDETLYDAILLGYALCNNGVVGLKARTIPLVIPRGHDCITLFLGSRERYQEYFTSNPGVYYLTSGWIERGTAVGELAQLSVSRRLGMEQSYEELVEKYGEDNAAFLWEEFNKWTENYSKITYIDMGITPEGCDFEHEARLRAQEKGWSFDKVPGDMSLLQRLVDAKWNPEDFLIVPPGEQVAVSYDDDIIRSCQEK